MITRAKRFLFNVVFFRLTRKFLPHVFNARTHSHAHPIAIVAVDGGSSYPFDGFLVTKYIQFSVITSVLCVEYVK